MLTWHAAHRFAVAFSAALAVLLTVSHVHAQRRKRAPPVSEELTGGERNPIRKQQPGAKELLEADVSARTVTVKTNFQGVEIVVFGAVDNSQQPSPEFGYYDLIIVVEGVPGRVVTRRRSNVAGLWVNTSSVTFDNVPTFYAVASTRPLDEIAPDDFRTLYRIGLRHLRLAPAFGQAQAVSPQELEEFREAVARLKQRVGLFIRAPFAARFTGTSLFSSRVELPPNVTVGPFDTRVYLFHDQKLLSEYAVRLNMEREGFERYLHAFAFGYPVLYGVTAVLISASAGLLAARILRKTGA